EHRGVLARQRPDILDAEPTHSPVEDRVVRPQRLVDRPPAGPGRRGPAGRGGLGLRALSVPARALARTEAAPSKLDGVVEIDQRRRVRELDRREREPVPPPDEELVDEALGAEP